MHLTLLLGANPKRSSTGPRVRLQAGRWKLDTKSVIDSQLVLAFESGKDAIEIQHDVEFMLEKADIAHIGFKVRGTEGSITVNARKIS